MKVMLVGGGSGGHLTPLLAVAAELRKSDPSRTIVYVGHRHDNLHSLVKQHNLIDNTHTIFAGKFRRYHGSGLRQLLDIPTMLKNFRDLFYLLIGFIQSLFILIFDRPAVIFVKGGFVGVPVGLAARVLRVKYITHDSDALPGLANRILAKGAAAHAVAMPIENYPYAQTKTFEVGVPVAGVYEPLTESDVEHSKQQLEIDSGRKVLLIAGGGLGAQRLNNACIAIVDSLLSKHTNLVVLHQVGAKNEAEISKNYDQVLPPKERARVRVYGFTDRMALLSAAADVVVSRAGATAMAEFAVAGKAVIMVPNAMLTGGHQIKNAQVFADEKAALIVTEADFDKLEPSIEDLLNSSEKRQELINNLRKFARPDAAKKVADLIDTQVT